MDPRQPCKWQGVVITSAKLGLVIWPPAPFAKNTLYLGDSSIGSPIWNMTAYESYRGRADWGRGSGIWEQIYTTDERSSYGRGTRRILDELVVSFEPGMMWTPTLHGKATFHSEYDP